MADYVHLIGAEDVSRAGHNMKAAADEMQRAVSAMDDALHRHRLFMDQWLSDFQAAMAGAAEEKQP